MTSSNCFYVNLFSNASQEIYENNTHAHFTDIVTAHYLGTSPNWEVSVHEISLSSPALGSINTVDVTPCSDQAMIYCNLISPQFVGDSTSVSCGRSPPFPVGITSSETSKMCRWSNGYFNLYNLSSSHLRGCTSPSRKARRP